MAGPRQSSPTVVARLERQLAVEILRGTRPAHSRLPPVRELAAQLGVTVPTIQRVIERLESTGLVTVKRGSGITINDPKGCRDLALLPLWFEALADQPKRAAAILGDFLELRRVVAAHLIRTAYPRILAAAPELIAAARRIEPGTELADIVAAELSFTRRFIDAVDHFAIGTVFASTERLLYQVEGVAEALYGDRKKHREVIRRLTEAVATARSADQAATTIEEVLADWDRHSVRRFERLRPHR